MLIAGIFVGFLCYALFRVLLGGFYTIKPDERAAITSFGRAVRLGDATVTATDQLIPDEEKERYKYPVLKVVGPGGPYFKWPWQRIHKVSISTQAVQITWDPSKAQSTIEAVTKDNLTTGVNGQLRYRVSENNLYPYLFGVTSPLEHVMGFFVAVLRERIANFEDPKGAELLAAATDGEAGDNESGTAVELSEGVSINDLRKNLPLLNQYMEQQCEGTVMRYGIELDAALITEIDPPPEVDRALSAINSTRNQVAADISTARADAEQQITMSKRAVDIATNNAEAEVAPLKELAATLTQVKNEGGSGALKAYLRNMRLPLLQRTRRIIESSTNGGV
ncbi:SPFH domain-containing protein [Kiritimatiellaeota bacterium B1221]|nr:SPFH domain-containing protein [Kiritimatiellaeota bacterium B1221]